MATFVAPVSTSSNRPQLSPGTYFARCFQMILLGSHAETFQGELKPAAMKIRLGFEFPNEKAVFSPDKGEEPFVLGKEFKFTMHEKGTFRKTLESWRGQKFSEAAAQKFDAGTLLGVPCTINVVSYVKNDGSEGVKIDSVSPLMKGVVLPAQINKTQALTFDDFDYGLFESLPDFLKDKIKASPEYKAIVGESADPVFSPAPVDSDEPLPF